MRFAALTTLGNYLLLIGLLLFSLLLVGSTANAWQPDPEDQMELAVQEAILGIKRKDPGMQDWFDNSYAYAVFPRVGKGGIVVGGAHGKGIVIAGDQVIGRTSLTQGTIGLQLGGQVYSEFIFFRDETALNDFKRGNFELDAQASAIAVTKGASADASYNKGVAVFTNPTGGLMFEASVGGQKFTYEPL